MKSSPIHFGIVGPGMIAGDVANAIQQAKSATLTAVSSRGPANAERFATVYTGATAVEGTEALFIRPDVDAV